MPWTSSAECALGDNILCHMHFTFRIQKSNMVSMAFTVAVSSCLLWNQLPLRHIWAGEEDRQTFQANMGYVFLINKITGLSLSSELKSDCMNSSQSIWALWTHYYSLSVMNNVFHLSRMKTQENVICNDVHCCAVCVCVCMHVGGCVHAFLDVSESLGDPGEANFWV